MNSAGISELKAKLSEYLATVEAGGEVLVTDRGRPVARLVGAEGAPGASGADDGARLDRLQRAGIVRVGAGEIPAAFWGRRRAADPGAAVRRALLSERDEGR